jgi:glutamate--cysteine ligase
MDASVGGRPVRALAERIFELSAAGLRRRARIDTAGRDESVHLVPLGELVEKGWCPADVLREGLASGDAVDRAELVRRTRL